MRHPGVQVKEPILTFVASTRRTTNLLLGLLAAFPLPLRDNEEVERVLRIAVIILAACGTAGAALIGATQNKAPSSAPSALVTTTARPGIGPSPAAKERPSSQPFLAGTGESTSDTGPLATQQVIPPAVRQVSREDRLYMAGCPVTSRPSSSTAEPAPWHPATLVPDSALPPVLPPAPWHASLDALSGKGMWIWQWSQTAGGDARAVVHQAQSAGLHQLWVRVADSKNGFYGAAELEALVPAAHAAGLAVVAWGFPYLYDPVGDARWSAQVLAWRSGDGQRIDAFSPDIERSSEGVDLTARRVAVYLEQVRKAAGSVPVVATVYPPLDAYWSGGYPYSTIATYVDAFAPMVYWECEDPGAAARSAISRLSELRPVHLIGQAFSMASSGGRAAYPSAAEIEEFLVAARTHGALGASFWVWQTATAQEWSAVADFSW